MRTESIIQKFGLLMTMLLAIIPASSYAYDFEVDGICYNILNLSERTAEIVGTTVDEWDNLIIPSTVIYSGREIKVVSISNRAFFNKNIKTLRIGNNVKTILDNAFGSCPLLERVELSESVDSIIRGAFENCRRLTEIVFKSDYCFVDNDTFDYCYNLQAVNIPSLESWCRYTFDGYLFRDQKNISLFIDGVKLSGNISFPDGLTKVKPYTFSMLKDIKEVILPDAITKIGKAAFALSGITRINIPNSCDTICSDAFRGLQLEELRIPQSVKYLEEMGVFMDTRIVKFIIEASDTPIKFENSSNFFQYNGTGVQFEEFHMLRPIDGLLYQKANYKNGVWILDDPEYDASVFYGMKTLKKIIIGEKVNRISAHTFCNCPNLEEVIIEPSPKEIRFQQDFGFTRYNGGTKYMYYNPTYHSEFENSPLTYLYIGRNIILQRDSLDSYEEEYYVRDCDRPNPFNAKKTLKVIEIGNYVDSLPSDGFFSGCPLASITIGSSLSKIPDNTFHNENNTLCEIKLNSPIPPVYPSGFTNYEYLNSILYIPKESAEVYQNTAPWSNFWNIKSLEDCSGIKNIENTDGTMTVISKNGCIYILNKEEQHVVRVYSINGDLIVETSDDKVRNLSKGFYIVSVGIKSFKVFVR